MFRIQPIRVQLRQAGYGLLLFALMAYVCVWRIHHDSNSTTPFTVRDLLPFGVLAALTAFVGVWMSNGSWAKWHDKLKNQNPLLAGHAQAVKWTWTMTQWLLGAGCLGVSLLLWPILSGGGVTVDVFMFPVIVGIGQIGILYLDQARRIGRLERQCGGVYYWRRQPALEHTKAPVMLVYS